MKNLPYFIHTNSKMSFPVSIHPHTHSWTESNSQVCMNKLLTHVSESVSRPCGGRPSFTNKNCLCKVTEPTHRMPQNTTLKAAKFGRKYRYATLRPNEVRQEPVGTETAALSVEINVIHITSLVCELLLSQTSCPPAPQVLNLFRTRTSCERAWAFRSSWCLNMRLDEGTHVCLPVRWWTSPFGCV